MANDYLAGARACALAVVWATAQAQPPSPSPQRCEAPAHQGHPMQDRERRIAQYEALGRPCLEALTIACSSAADRALLDTQAAFECSIGYEALLRRGFDGDFQALLAWWRSLPGKGDRPGG